MKISGAGFDPPPPISSAPRAWSARRCRHGAGSRCGLADLRHPLSESTSSEWPAPLLSSAVASAAPLAVNPPPVRGAGCRVIGNPWR
jgi:hypothetical protein